MPRTRGMIVGTFPSTNLFLNGSLRRRGVGVGGHILVNDQRHFNKWFDPSPALIRVKTTMRMLEYCRKFVPRVSGKS